MLCGADDFKLNRHIRLVHKVEPRSENYRVLLMEKNLSVEGQESNDSILLDTSQEQQSNADLLGELNLNSSNPATDLLCSLDKQPEQLALDTGKDKFSHIKENDVVDLLNMESSTTPLSLNEQPKSDGKQQVDDLLGF